MVCPTTQAGMPILLDTRARIQRGSATSVPPGSECTRQAEGLSHREANAHLADHKNRWSAPRHRQECLFYSTREPHREAIYSITAMNRLFVFAISLLLALLPATACLAADLALTPPMGWNSWN